MSKKVVLAGACRTAIGTMGGSLSTIPAVDLGAIVIKEALNRAGVKPEDVVPEASFVDDLGADSLDTVELVMALEEEFGTDIPDEDAEKINTVKAAIDYINAHKE